MNQHTIKIIKAGIFAGSLAAIIEIIISAAMTKYLSAAVDVVQLIPGGLTTGLITLFLTIVISTVIAGYKQKTQEKGE